MNVEDNLKITLRIMFETNVIDRDKYNAYVYEINCWIERIDRLEKENGEQKKKISELESELSVKGNLLKIKSRLCGEKDLDGLTPIKAAELIIENFKQGVCPIYERDSKENIKYMDIDGEKYAVETGIYRKHEEVRRIAEHLLVYCNHNSEDR